MKTLCIHASGVTGLKAGAEAQQTEQMQVGMGQHDCLGAINQAD